MKLSRRKAMGAVLGGAIAGPDVAKQAAQQFASKFQSMNYKGVPVEFDKIPSVETKANETYLKAKLLDERDYLIKLINDELNNTLYIDKRAFKNEAMGKNIDCLKSVADSSKHRIYHWTLEERYKKERIKDAIERLPGLLKQLTGL